MTKKPLSVFQPRADIAAMNSSSRILAVRTPLLGLAKLIFLALYNFPFAKAAPVLTTGFLSHQYLASESPESPEPSDPSLWLYLGISAFLVLSGGAFAGLTIALMGQDEVYLRVIQTSGEESEKKNAASVLSLLQRGKHWVLVTLLLSNVITNETLPIVLDRTLGGGWPAVLGSTALIVIFGEVVPQSICVRYGLPIGAWMAPGVLVLMYIMSPVAWPVAKLLDRLLGEDHGTIYKKNGLKTLVTLHKTLGKAGEQLNSDEVTIISAVLDLKEKSIGSIMTPMEYVFTMSTDTVLDERTMDHILSQGFSRIPIYASDNSNNFVGMLLVKMLITYDPEDCKLVSDFALATLPETRPETSCLDIVNFFQEGKSHMVLVSEYPSEDRGALGVVTLEDVIEELIGEEIIDESDVFIDVHKAIRRMAPPIRRRDSVEAPATRFQLRKHNADGDGLPASEVWITERSSTDRIREQLKHLGPSNLASRPRETRYHAVKIKRNASPAASPLVEGLQAYTDNTPLSIPEAVHEEYEETPSSPVRRTSSGAGSTTDLPDAGPARSGFIKEQIVDVNGIRKIVLHASGTSSSDSENREPRESLVKDNSQKTSKKRRNKKKRGQKSSGDKPTEQQPLLR